MRLALRLIAPFAIRVREPISGYNIPATVLIKKHVDIPVIVVGGMRNIDEIEQVVSQGTADCVSLCRPFIIEPDIVNRFREGTQKESRCINCSYCFFGVTGSRLRCYYGKLPKKAAPREN